MANDTKYSCKVKDHENSSAKEISGNPSTDPGAETSNATGLRRSGRETPSKKNRCPSPPSSRKSERLEKRTPTPPVMRKSERVEKQSAPNALRRSERGKKQSSSSSSGSKKSNKRLDLSGMQKKLKKEKSVRQLTLEPKIISKIETEEPAQMGKKIKNARDYKEIFRQKARKLDVPGSPSRNFYTGKESGEKKVQDLREVSAGKELEKTLSDCSVSKLPNEILEIGNGQESSCSSQNIRSAGARWSEDGDSVKDSKGGDGPLLLAYKAMSRKLDLDAETAKENLNSELVNTALIERAPDSDVRVENGYKEISLKRKRDKHDPDSDSTAMASSKDICPCVTDAISSFVSGNKPAETCAKCFKRKSDNHGSKQQDLCLCGANSNQIIRGAIVPKEGNGADVTGELIGKTINNLLPKDSAEDIQLDGDRNTCLRCKLGGKLLCCEGKGCKRSYHLFCIDPPLKDVPLEDWYCLACVKKRIKLGAHSVSEGIESIWKVEMSEENGLQKKHFLVKYKGLAHVHNRWVSESLLLLEAHSLLTKFNRKNQVSSWKDEWTEPHRMLQKRFLGSPKQFDEVHGGHLDDVCLWLVKWRGLDYEKATWELENDSFMRLPKAQSLIRDYENRLERAKKIIHKEIQVEKGSVKPMQLPAGGSTEIDNGHQDFCNSLREQWHKGQNVVIIEDLERITKVITFIASLSSDGCWPFLIITSSAALWDEEFFRLAPSIAAVVYLGSKDIRRGIRAVEFYVEGSGVMFDVLITSPEVVVEDLDVLHSIKWETVIVDDCLRPRIYSHSGQFKSLSTKMRLLLVNGQLKDGIIEHLLPLLDCHSDITGSEGLITNSDQRIRDFKEKLSKYIIDGRKSDTSRFIEYWVPVQISNAQLEQYCATLLSNSLSLCSSSNSKNDPVGAFRDIVISNRKCCDHPYITDPLLGKHLTKDLQMTDFLDVGIKASGKLQLLDAMLLEIRNRGLRVLILFQSSGGSPKDNIGDILDDFVRQRFGEDSYERLEVLVNPGRKQTALNKFNNQKSRFVFLLETRACLPSIKLSSVDTVIIFGSDWNPANDLRSLQKITLDTQSQQLKVFRLYSSFTVEENALILAKHHKPLDSNLQSISRATGHNLLKWGVAYLFCKLDEFHGCCTLATSRSTSFERASREDIIRDFVNKLTQNAKDYTSNKSSIILKAKQNQGNYSTDFPLPGEQKIQESDADLPHIFWKKLLDRKQPQWKYTSGLSQCNRKRVQHRDEVLKKVEGRIEEVVKKRKKVANNNCDQTSARPAAESEGGLGVVPQGVRGDSNSGSTTYLNASNANHTSNFPTVAHDKSELPAVDMAKFGERIDLRDSQKSLHALLKPEIAKLCDILQLPEDVKAMAQSFLEYVVNNHCVIKEPVTILQAFHISLCWTAASMSKYKIDHKESFELAKKHLDFGCRKEEADYVYSMLKCLKKMFIYRNKNLMPAYSPETSDSFSDVNKVHHGKSSLSTPSGLQRVKDKFEDLAHGQESVDDQVLSQLGQHAFSRSIKDIEKKCDKQMTKLLQKQQEEIVEHKTKYENEKAQLETKKKTEAAVIRLHSSSSMRADKLRQLDIEYKEKFEELNCRMELDLENLQKMHVVAKEKVEKRKESWLQGIKSWAKRDFIANVENASSLNSHLKKQNSETMESMEDREVQVEVQETVSTSDDMEVLITGVLCTGKQNPDEVKSHMPDGEAALGVSKSVFTRHSLEIPIASFTVPDRKISVEVSENANTAISESMGAPETARIEAMVVGTTMTREDYSGPVMVCDNDIQLNQQDELLCVVNSAPFSIVVAGSEAPKSASNKVLGHTTGEQQDGEVAEAIVNKISYSSDKTTGVTTEDEDIPSGTHEIPGGVDVCETRELQDVEAPSAAPKTADAVKPNATSDQQDKNSQSVDKSDGKGVLDKSIVNEIFDSSKRITAVAQQNEDSPSGVPTIAGQVQGDETGVQQDVEATSAVPKTADVVKGNESSYKRDGKVQVTENVDNKQSQSLDIFDTELLAGVTESAPDEAAENTSASDEISGVRVVGPTLSARPSQEDDLTLSQNLENVRRLVEGDCSGKEINGVSAVNEDNHPHVSSLARQEQCIQRTSSTRLQDRLPSAIEIDNPLQQFEPSVDQADIASTQTNTDAPNVDHALQMPSTDSDFSPNAVDPPSAGEYEHPSSYEGNINIAESSAQMVGDQVEQSNQAVETPLGGSGMHVSDTRTVPISSGANNCTTQTVPPTVRVPPLAFCRDPLQNELERIRKETDQIISAHEDMKLQLKSDCEKEIQEIRRKYETKFQEVESEFLSRKKELDVNHNKVLMNKILAEAFRSKCMDIKGSSAPSVQQDVPSSFLQQLLLLSSQPTNARRNLSGVSSAGPPAVGPQITHRAAPSLRPVLQASAPVSGAPSMRPAPVSGAPSMRPLHQPSAPVLAAPSIRPSPVSGAPSMRPVHQPSAPVSAAPSIRPLPASGAPSMRPVHQPSAPLSAGPSLRPVHQSSAPVSAAPTPLRPVHPSSAAVPGSLTRPPLIINSISPATGNVHIASEIRAPAPHLQPFRPAASTNTPPAVGMLSQQVPSNLATTPTTPSQVQLQPQPASEQSQPGNVPHQCEATRIMPSLSSSAVLEIESLMGEDNERNSNPSCSIRPQSDLASNTDPAVLPELRQEDNTRTDLTCTNEVVCLSDDDSQ